MVDRPIIFSAPMVRALLEGRKTQTRRLAWRNVARPAAFGCPTPWQRVKPGDRLWVRESWRPIGDLPLSECTGPADIRFSASVDEAEWAISKWRPSIHMPRWASRLTLVVTEVRRQRLQEISKADAIAEGISAHATVKECRADGLAWGDVPADAPDDAIYWLADYQTKGDEDYAITLDPRESFRGLWASIHGSEEWAGNPEVVALTFIVHRCNIDAMERAAA